MAALVTLWRRWPVAIYLALGAVVAAVLVMIVPFGPTTTWLAKLLFTCFLWGFASFCVAAIFGAVELLVALVRWITRRGAAPGKRALRHPGPLPELSPGKQAQVRRAVKLMTEAGLFHSAPDPALLYAGVAERGDPVKPVMIFDAMMEADYYHPGFSWSAHMANLVQHGTQVEQPQRYIAEQIADLARLSGGALDVRDVTIELSSRGEGRIVDTRIAMTVNGEAVTLTYAGSDKYLSTVLHHDLAVRMRDLGNGRRFAWMWDDGGPWISCLADGTAEQLNAAFRLGEKSAGRWTWIDAELPHAAGER